MVPIIAAIPAAQAWAQGDAPPPGNPSGRPAVPAGAEPAPNAAPGSSAAPAAGGTAPRPLPSAPPPTDLPTDAPAPASASAEAPPPRRMVASLSHDLQFGLALMIGGGYRGIFPYETMINCGDAKAPDSRVCTNRAPFFVDLQPSFGIATNWDFLVDLRFGIEKDFNTHRQFYAMPGFRYWLDSQSRVKFFTTIQLAYDRSRQNSPAGAPHPVGDNDLGFRNSNGLMVEVMRNFGVYFQFGETIAFYRWMSFLVDAGIGVQARLP
ncbi:MAG: hypothetical protein ABUL77_03695 [Bacteroidota bacterium]